MLESVTSIKDFSQGKLVALYGKSGSGKTTLGATFPKPMLYVKIGDDTMSDDYYKKIFSTNLKRYMEHNASVVL